MPWLAIVGARQNNLRQVTARFPLGRFTCVTGVSGSGKSSLVNEILYEALARDLNGAHTAPGTHERIDGVEYLDKIIAIDQSPIGRTPRSNPATYIKVFDEIRKLFAKLPDAKLRGYKPSRFSFNVAAGPRGGGRCEACEGNGANRIEMDFLADVWVECPVCGGHRFGRETLQVQYKHKSISDVLEMDVQEALAHFDGIDRIRGMLQTLHDVGLDYLKLGQPSNTLSGGEAQRIKLARELVKKPTGRTIYVLDEPTTGLHFEDIRRLLDVLHSFVDAGNTVIVIEHNTDVIKTADWIIDLGPEGGAAGGAIIAAGTPEEVAANAASHTGQALAAVFAAESHLEFTAPVQDVADVDDWGAAASADEAAPRRYDPDAITVVGAQQHNLKDLTVSIPRDQITVCSGVSGSGKTSFAIDTVFTEGYRRYVESLSAYARQFLGQMQKPRVDYVEGLSPAICIEQKAASKSPRSTVGTITEIYDYMRVLWARLGTPHCPKCDVPMGSQTVDEITDRVMALETGAPIILLAPVELGDNETYTQLLNRLKASGYTRVRIDGEIVKTAEARSLDVRRRHRVEVVIDRTIVRAKSQARIAESIEHACTLGDGKMKLLIEAVETVHDDHNAEADAAAPRKKPRTRKSREREIMFSQKLACTQCGESYEELGPNHFSFNSQMGWCETCEGLGVQRGAPQAEIVKHPNRTLFDGAIAGWPRIRKATPMGRMLGALCEHLEVDSATPLAEWPENAVRALMFGTTGEWIDGGDAFAGVRFHWRGFFPTIDAATRNSWQLRHRLHNVVTDIPCVACRGGRLRPDAAAVRFAGETVVGVSDRTLGDSLAFFKKLRLRREQKPVAGELLHEIRSRLQFLVDVGLDYLTLHRAAPTLSGGEAQRIRLASQIGSGLSGVLYVLDEPTIGLHPRDTQRLIDALARLRELGNTLIVVEHDRDVIKSADRLVDFGPRAGAFGGRIVAEGPPAEFLATKRRRAAKQNGDGESLTKRFLSGTDAIAAPENRRPVDPEDCPSAAAFESADNSTTKTRGKKRKSAKSKRAKGKRGKTPTQIKAAILAEAEHNPDAPADKWLVVRGARQNNLRGVDVQIPLGRFVCITGVSGSGKSSLVNDILAPGLSQATQLTNVTVGAHDRIDGVRAVDKVINCDQSPIGATPSSNPATYTGVFDWIRDLFTRLPDSKVRGYEPKRFSFNRPGGRCEACEGYGRKCIEMHFMPDVWVECEVCHGKRYNPETLEVKFKGRSIADVLDMRVGAALELFDNVPRIRRMLQTLVDVGLDYVQLGQPAPTLSGGEAQRVKLATELGKPDTGRTVYILDEPTTGLHFDDVRKLVEVIHRLVDLGNTAIVVEHNLDVLKNADWIIDLGPEAGAAGGRIVASGTPEDVVRITDSRTGACLAPILTESAREMRARFDPRAHAEAILEVARKGLGDVGKDTQQPWQVDGRRWHLEQRTSRGSQPTRWESAALEYVVELVQKSGKGRFGETNWSNRASVEITAPNAHTWFLHALTGGEWLLELYFRSPPGAFDWIALNEQLGLLTLDEREDLETYGDWARVDVRPRRDGFDAVVVYVHDKAEIDTPAFRRFVREVVQAYLAAIDADDREP